MQAYVNVLNFRDWKRTECVWSIAALKRETRLTGVNRKSDFFKEKSSTSQGPYFT